MSIDPNNLGATAKLTFADEFDGLSLWNGKSGVWSSNWWYNDEWGLYSQNRTATDLKSVDDQWYVNANFAGTKSVTPWTTSNGVLTIEAAKTPPELASLTHDLPYTSGLLNTWHSFSQQYGYFEISAKMPAGQGLWPAFWLLPKNGDWPPEIDVFEVLGHDTKTLVQTIHTEATGSHTYQANNFKTVDLSLDFHRYGVDWQKDYITFYFDGRETAQYATPADMHTPMYMITNLTVGGPWSGNPDASTVFPAKLQVDYVHVYTEAPGGGAATPAADAAATPTAPATKASLSLQGGAAQDHLVGQAGDDVIAGAGGADTISGGEGADAIDGDDGADQINGNVGADTVHGGGGDDWAVGGKDADQAFGDDGEDIVYGNMGADSLWGGAGADIVRGGQDNDVLYGGDGNDWMAGDRGSDTLSGGAGADTFHVFDGAGLDRVLDFNRAEGDHILLPTGAAYTVAASGADTVVSVGSDEIVLVGVSPASLTGDWIAFG
jgi:beta-glucanase (GH16 family)